MAQWPCRIFGGGDADMVAAHLFYREMRMVDQQERQESDPVPVLAGCGAWVHARDTGETAIFANRHGKGGKSHRVGGVALHRPAGQEPERHGRQADDGVAALPVIELCDTGCGRRARFPGRIFGGGDCRYKSATSATARPHRGRRRCRDPKTAAPHGPVDAARREYGTAGNDFLPRCPDSPAFHATLQTNGRCRIARQVREDAAPSSRYHIPFRAECAARTPLSANRIY